MATGEHFTSDQVQEELEKAGDDGWTLCQIIMRYSLWKKGDPDLPKSTDEIKIFIKKAIDAEKATKRAGLEELKTRLDTMMTHLAQKWELEIQSKVFYDNTVEVLESDNVTQFLLCLLGLLFPNHMDILRKASAVLESGEVRIMIIGEICAGKSTILNLLMGGSYLAVDHGPCTNVICELKDSESRCATIHYKERLKMNPKNVPLTTDPNTDDWKRVRNCITSGFDGEQSQQSGKGKPNIDKVVIFWPVLRINVVQEDCSQGPSDSAKSRNVKDSSERTAALEEIDTKECGGIRVTFVDSPGFGDDQETFSNLQSKALSCDAYIFVINNGSHHGVEKDRLGKMMKKVQERARVSNIILNPSSAFFICNKADLVPPEKKETLRTDVLRRLQAIWPGISEQQIFSFSASQAFKEVIHRKITQTYCEFINQICKLVVNAHHLKLEKHCCWLISFLESASALANNCNRHRDFVKQKREEALEEILSHERNLNQLYKECSDTLERLKSTGILDLKKSIKSCLSVKGSDLCTWSLENIPSQRNTENWSRYNKRLTKEIINRIKATVLDDSDVNKLLDEYSEVLKAIIEKFHTTKLERSLFRHEILDVIPRWSILDDLIIPILDMFIKFYTYFLWGVDPFSLKYVPALKDRERAGHDEDDSREDDFESDRLQFMQTLSSTHVKRSMVEPYLTHLALDISETVESEARVLIENIDQGRKTLKEYSRAIVSGMKISCNNDPFRTIASECHYFYTLNVMQHEIEFSRLRLGTVNMEPVIGEGGFGRVLKGELQEGSQNIPVAAKIIKCFRRYIDNAAVPDDMTIFRECCLMRQLMLKMNVAEDGGCPNFVHYYGSTSTETDDAYELILVMELCDTDLYKQVKAGSLIPYDNIPFPGKVSKEGNTSVSYAIDIALQAARGLHFVHKNGIVHRDIKPSNFLMNVRHGQIIVKISDVGLSKEQNKITTFASDIGTLVYQAPENLNIPLSIHSVFSDVYSFGLLLWEVWYGEHVFSEVPDNQLRRHLIKKHPAFKNVKPPKPLINLMNMCWRKKPITRPDMEKVVDELATLKQN